jgi:hypothetical protein
MVRKCHLNVKSRKKDEVSYLLCVCGFAQHFPGKIEKKAALKKRLWLLTDLTF